MPRHHDSLVIYLKPLDTMLTSFFVFILTLLILVTIHEFGHFWVAKRMGVKVLRFSVGFGKPMISWQGKCGTEYAISWLPLGGYVRLLDEREGAVDTTEKHLAFNNKSIWRRCLIVMAGPAINLLFAVIAFWLVFMLGIETVKPVIGDVLPNSIAAEAGVLPHQIIQSVNHQATESWQDVAFALLYRLGEKGTLAMTTSPFPKGDTESFKLNLTHWKVDDLEPDLIKSLGIVPYHPPLPAVIGALEKNEVAKKAGLKIGDRVISMNGEPVKDWEDWVIKIFEKPNQTITLLISRDLKTQTVTFKTSSRFMFRVWRRIGFIGVKPEKLDWPANMRQEEKYSSFGSISPAIKQTSLFLKLNLIIIVKMFKGEVSLRALGGPITIYQIAGQAFKQGATIYISFLGLMSVMLAFVNILPIPGLDGGHLVYFAIEKIRKKPLSAHAQVLMVRLGMIVLVVLIFQVMMNDLMRLF